MVHQQQNIEKLAGLDDWQLEQADQDLRGKTLCAAHGLEIGKIEDMLANLEDERIVALRLEDGRIVNIDAVDVRAGEPVLVIDPALLPPPASIARGQETSEHIPGLEKTMNIGNREVELGKVRVRSRVPSEEMGEEPKLPARNI